MRMGKKIVSLANADDPDRPATDERDILGELACTNTALRRAARRLGQLYDEALAPLDLKATQIGLIAEIERFSASGSEQGPTLQDLGGSARHPDFGFDACAKAAGAGRTGGIAPGCRG